MKKIKVLLLAANPVDSESLRVGQAIRNIFDEIDLSPLRDRFDVVPQPAMKPSDLQRCLLKYQPDIVHFIGHGNADSEIVLEDRDGKSMSVDKAVLTTVFRLHKKNIRLIFFNACFTKTQAEAVSEVIDYTIGIDNKVTDAATIAFGSAFYMALANNCSVDKAFNVAKLQLDLLDIPGSNRPELFVRPGADSGVEFEYLIATEPQERDAELRRALVQLVGGKADYKERELVKSELALNSVVLEQVDGGATTESEVATNLAANQTLGSIRLELSESAYQRVRDQLYPGPQGLLPPLPGLTFVGRDDSLTDIKTRLTNGGLTVVRGVPGVGKTTLVGVLARDPEIASRFPDGILWTALEQRPELMSIIAKWGRYLGADDLLRIASLDEATERLGNLLRHKQMLLIVDDIWDAAHASPFLRAATTGKSQVLATTRLTSVADLLAAAAKSAESIYRLPELSEENALILLRLLSPEAVDQYFEKCLQLVRDVEYLPLALHVAGRLLNQDAKLGFSIPELIDDIREKAALLPAPAPMDRAEGATLPTVSALLHRSTDVLDEATRECFAFLGVFAPKPATFDVSAMKAVWEVDDPKPIIRKLVDHGLLEAAGGGRFQMHALLVQHASSLLD